ncbi:MAG: hypothetical protein A2V92_04995 [Candidatus Muproteobacteria bacterium RBG_16_65_31]|uniref:Protein kinase domain-containing protein n=1 Tax=Candidatus Muproteobacteria bacterium RBG_16_65_31 TaxID=1817759 RepID=A0A1F6TG52_9PROT|nr:MAG: hypothetical protein A2V92_04995 [Candidatus Muproteobacteria bacterium RBG_16_65_31]
MAVKIEHALPVGYLLLHYRIAKTIGSGGFSIVYLAYDIKNGRPVVIKEYLPSNQATRLEDETVESLSEGSTTFHQGMKRFFDEAAALARIVHPNIVRVLDFFRENNTVYLVMEHHRGKDLRWYIKRRARGLSEKFIRTVFPPLLHGLRELHNNNLLHLDIKPANIFLRQGGNPLLLDFGAARESFVAGRASGPHTMTLGFAPIEQHRRGYLGPWTDLYAIGATMWACMSGEAPPPATERAEEDTYKPAVRAFARRYSPQLLEAVDWCLHMNQLERPQKVDDLLDFMNQPRPEVEDEEPRGYLARLGFRLPWGGKKSA